MKKYLWAISALSVFAVVVFAQVGGTFTDKRDGQTYKTVKIGKQVWMAQNLNYAAKESVCYDNDASNCDKYGRLYKWETALKACPAGWHLPSDAEWTTLVNFVGEDSTAGTKLKSSQYWQSYSGVPDGTDEYGFSALPGGGGNSGGFYNAGYYGDWWSATEYDASSAWDRYMNCHDEYVDRNNYYKTYLFSVRCVQDGGKQ